MSTPVLPPLHQAARDGDLPLLRQLLAMHPALLDACDDEKCTPIYHAAFAGHMAAVELLASQGARLTRSPSPLVAALAEGNEQIADALFERGARIPSECMFEGRRWFRSLCGSRTALAVGLCWDRKDALGIDGTMLSEGFFAAVEHGQLETIDLFAHRNLSLETQQSFFRNSSLHQSAISREAPDRRVAVMERLFDMGHWPRPSDKVGVLSQLMSTHPGDWPRLVELFLDRGMPPAGGNGLVSPLHRACRRGALDIVKVFLARGAPVDLRDEDGNTPLMWACLARECLPLMEYLLARGADVHAIAGPNEHGKGVMHHAADNASPAVLGLLLGHGADLHDRDRSGNNPLHYAALGRRADALERVRFLLARGADAHARNHAGCLPGQAAPGCDPVREDVASCLEAVREGRVLDEATPDCLAVPRTRRI